jgi:Domain of unknown function (DUF4294)
VFFFAIYQKSNAQDNKGIYDTILVSVKIIGTDTLPFRYLNPVYARAKKPKWASIKKDPDFMILRHNVYKTYPYALRAAAVLNEVDSVLATIYSKEAKRAYKDRKESELNAKFNKELTNLTMDQGKILVKLISRETGKSVYEIVKSMKGGLNARLFQGLAVLWDNNLKHNYDPNGADASIEYIVREIQSRNMQR